MAVKELNDIYGEVGRNLDNQMDENVLIPGETGTKTFGAFKFFSGIKKFLEGSAKKIIKGGLEVDSLTVSGSRPLFNQDIKTVIIDLYNGNEVTFEKDNLHNTGLYVARFTYDFGEYIDLNQYKMIGLPRFIVPYTNSNAPNLFFVTNAYNAKNLTGAYIFAINNISIRAWFTATFVRK